MKKKVRRLALSRETLHSLENEVTRRVVGGDSYSCDRTCECTLDRTCECTLDRTCQCTLDRTCTC